MLFFKLKHKPFAENSEIFAFSYESSQQSYEEHIISTATDEGPEG